MPLWLKWQIYNVMDSHCLIDKFQLMAFFSTFRFEKVYLSIPTVATQCREQQFFQTLWMQISFEILWGWLLHSETISHDNSNAFRNGESTNHGTIKLKHTLLISSILLFSDVLFLPKCVRTCTKQTSINSPWLLEFSHPTVMIKQHIFICICALASHSKQILGFLWLTVL